jgi:peptidoglycan hydrolase-like protein with peptidoglycan-binding domain
VPTPPHFSAKSFVESNPNLELTRDKFPDQFNTFILLHKIATIITRFEITNKQLFWIFEYGPNVDWLNLNTLPIISDYPPVPDDPDVSFDQWLRLLELFKLRDRLPLGEFILDEIFNIARSGGGTSPPDPEELVKQIRERLSENNRWNPTDLDFVVREVFAANKMPEKFKDERVMTRIWDCFLLINGLKMSAKLCRDLSDADVTQDVSRNVRQSIRARYDSSRSAENTEENEQWFSVAKPLRDGLREKQRTALVDYLVTHMVIPYAILEWPHPILEIDVSSRAVKELKQKLNATGIVKAPKAPLVVNNSFDRDTHDAVVSFQEANNIEPADGVVGPETWSKLDTVRRAMRDRNDLYSHFVIDVEMNSCMVTSRIKQAVSSIQLFVQRSLMNLEESVEAGVEVDKGWRHWTWMKNYRVWEANRKVFLYPENWIEPELRDDKSPFFKELESKLLQDELTDEVTEDALLGYLAELDEVARLQIVTMYHQVEEGSDDDIDILHVIGRTLTTPHVYYYRQYVKPAQWTPWEKVDLDIEGDHLLLIVWNRRLYLFWSIFGEEKEVPGAPDNKSFSGKIVWSERRQNNWLVKREAPFKEDLITHKNNPPAVPLVTLRSEIDVINNNLLIIICGPTPNRNEPVSDILPSQALVFNGCNSDPVSIRYFNHPERTIFNTGHIYNFFYEFGRDEPVLYLPAPSNELPGLQVLDLTPGDFYLLPPHDMPDIITSSWVSKLYRHSFFYMDNTRTFFVSPEIPEHPERNWWKPGEVNPASVLRIQKNYFNELKAFQTNTASPTMVTNKESERLETSFEITPIKSGETATVLPSEINITSAKTQTKTTDINNTSLSSAGLVSQNPNTNTPMAISANRGTEETTKILSESIRSIMESNENPASLTAGQILAFMGFEQNEIQYRFHTFYHPYTCVFTRELNRSGVDGLLQHKMQIAPQTLSPRLRTPLDFSTDYSPHDSANPIPIVKEPYPEEDINFEYTDAYASYNWELFFHIPLLIAERLSKNQNFEEAQKWFHRIFDPTDASTLESPQRYWRTKPFYYTEDYEKQRIQILLKLLAIGSDPNRRAELPTDQLLTLVAFEKSVDDWRDNPFQPHLVARTRSTSYQKNVVMKYIDNLIAWGDQLFRRETIESINEATQLYIMAAEILGRRPEEFTASVTHFVQTYNSLEPLLDDFFSNALIQIEELISPSIESHRSFNPGLRQATDVTLPTILYFCVPKNDKLLGYWDTVADRLFKIRHCMNIQGTVRQLPLFEPPIDPALLVKAAAAGIDISSVLNDINPTLPLYRFNILTQKATELCSELKSLGAALLATLEKRDTEKLALIRAEHETSLLKLIELVKEEQYNEEVQNQVALRKSREISLAKYLYYQKLLGVKQPNYPAEGDEIPDQASSSLAETEGQASVKMIPAEREELSHLKESESLRKEASEREFLANIYHIYPNVTVGIGTTTSFGGTNLGLAIQAWANMAKDESAVETFEAAMVSRIGQYTMRGHEWSLQSNLAAKEIMQIDKQIVASEIRKEIAKQELSNHVKQIQNARQVEDFMRSKYTNQELYSWMIGQVSAIYFQSYQLAFDVAKRSEAAYRFELGLDESNFIQFGYWDSLKRGLLVGERLHHDIKRLEVAYLEQNQREYEITKHVSLLRLDPVALAQLKQTGECFVSVPEALFDLDYPGHYFRRIKNASLTVPCVTGPYVGVNCTLTLLKSSIRHSNKLLGNDDKKYSRIKVGDDSRFRDNNGAIQSIVTSSGQNDSGLFETNLKDERYLPFEGSGAISEWHIQLPRDFRQLDYDTISDIILHLRYNAREGGEPLRNQAVTELQDALNEFLRTEGQNGLALPVSLRHEFPNEWHNFLNPQKDSHGHPTLTMNLGPERFPFLFQGRPILINKIEMFVKVRPIFASSHNKDTLNISLEPPLEPPLEPRTDPTESYLDLNPWNGLLRATKSKDGGLAGKLGNWTLTGWNEHEDTPDGRIDPNAIEDILVVCHYFLS